MTHYHLFIEQVLCYCRSRHRHCRFFMHRFDTFNCFTSNAVHIDIENCCLLVLSNCFLSLSILTNHITDNTVIYVVFNRFACNFVLFFSLEKFSNIKRRKEIGAFLFFFCVLHVQAITTHM